MEFMKTLEDGRRLRGAASRRSVMERAVNMASMVGLDGLSMGTLAAETALSKGGVVGLFGTKEKLQLATVENARAIFITAVIAPALEAPSGGPRLAELIERWLQYSQGRIFPGGCFFAAASADVRSRPGPVHDAVASAVADWLRFVTGTVDRAIRSGDLPPETDTKQVAFEITAILEAANSASVLYNTSEPYDRARSALKRFL